MIVFRWIGWILIALAIAAAGHEVIASISGGGYRPFAFGELWYIIHRASLNLVQAVVQRYISPWLWDAVIATILLWPAWLVMGVPGLVIAWAARRRRERYGIRE